MALYIAIIGLATVIGILLNYRTNPVFTACKIVGSVAVLIAGALSLCFVINPYLFNDFRELIICFALTAVALIAAYIAAQYFEYRAQAKNKAQDQTPVAKKPAQEVPLAKQKAGNSSGAAKSAAAQGVLTMSTPTLLQSARPAHTETKPAPQTADSRMKAADKPMEKPAILEQRPVQKQAVLAASFGGAGTLPKANADAATNIKTPISINQEQKNAAQPVMPVISAAKQAAGASSQPVHTMPVRQQPVTANTQPRQIPVPEAQQLKPAAQAQTMAPAALGAQNTRAALNEVKGSRVDSIRPQPDAAQKPKAPAANPVEAAKPPETKPEVRAATFAAPVSASAKPPESKPEVRATTFSTPVSASSKQPEQKQEVRANILSTQIPAATKPTEPKPAAAVYTAKPEPKSEARDSVSMPAGSGNSAQLKPHKPDSVRPVYTYATKPDAVKKPDASVADQDTKGGVTSPSEPGEAQVEKKANAQTALDKHRALLKKAQELAEQQKFLYAGQLLNVLLDSAQDLMLKKQAEILQLDCLVQSGMYEEAQSKLFELINKQYALDTDDKARIKAIMTKLKS